MSQFVPPRVLRFTLVMIALLGAAAWLLLSASAARDGRSTASLPPLPPELAQVREALAKYQDPVVAVRDGYFSTLGCVEYAPNGPSDVPYVPGAMGIHFLNPALIAPVPDPLRPPILVYEPQGDALRLVAAEWFVPLATGVTERPHLFGRPFDGPMAGHEPLMRDALHHYDLHVWLWKTNPAGLFADTNPDVRCPATGYTFKEHPPRRVSHHEAHARGGAGAGR